MLTLVTASPNGCLTPRVYEHFSRRKLEIVGPGPLRSPSPLSGQALDERSGGDESRNAQTHEVREMT